jgi:hypothetical protein
MGCLFAMKARMIETSGTVSYAPPVCPVRPFASETAVKKTIASRHSWMFAWSVVFSSGVSVCRDGSSLRGLSFGQVDRKLFAGVGGGRGELGVGVGGGSHKPADLLRGAGDASVTRKPAEKTDLPNNGRFR